MNHDINLRYRYLYPLGFGTYGSVIAVKDKTTNQTFALKYSYDLSVEININAIITRIQHYTNSIITIHEYGSITRPLYPTDLYTDLDNALWDNEDNNIIQYYLMEYIPYSLDKILNIRDDMMQISCLFELTLACLALNKVSIIHRDLHEHNIMCRSSPIPRVYYINNIQYVVTSKYMPVIIDFGQAFVETVYTPHDNFHDIAKILPSKYSFLYHKCDIDDSILKMFASLQSTVLPPNYTSYAPIQLL